MDFILDENPTRKNIILLLKKNGGMSIEELSRVIEITPMGIRQHLLALEKKGIVTYEAKKRGIGRPGFIYMLTETASELFPKAYDKFAVGLLRDIKRFEGHEKIDQIFSWRRDRMFNKKKEVFSDASNMDTVVQKLKNMLESEGHFVEINKGGDYYELKQYHCPINKVASEFKEACKHELMLYQELIDKRISLEQTVCDGASACVYHIPIKNN